MVKQGGRIALQHHKSHRAYFDYGNAFCVFNHAALVRKILDLQNNTQHVAGNLTLRETSKQISVGRVCAVQGANPMDVSRNSTCAAHPTRKEQELKNHEEGHIHEMIRINQPTLLYHFLLLHGTSLFQQVTQLIATNRILNTLPKIMLLVQPRNTYKVYGRNRQIIASLHVSLGDWNARFVMSPVS